MIDGPSLLVELLKSGSVSSPVLDKERCWDSLFVIYPGVKGYPFGAILAS